MKIADRRLAVGSEFRLPSLLEDHPDVDARRPDSSIYAGNRASLTDVPAELASRLTVVGDKRRRSGRRCRRRADVRFRGLKSHNDNSLLDPLALHPDEPGKAFTLLEAVRRHKVRFHHLHRDEVQTWSWRSREVHADRPTTSSPYFSSEGGFRPVGARGWHVPSALRQRF